MVRGFMDDEDRFDDDEGVHFEDVECIRETDAAILVEGNIGTDDSVWIPKANVHHDSEVSEEGDSGTLIVKTWFAKKEGWA